MYGWISFCRVYWIAFTSQSSGMQTRGTSPSKKARNHSSEVRINGGYLSHVSQTLGCLIACTVNCSRKETRQARSTRWPWKSTAVFSLKCKFHYHTWRHFQRYVSHVIWSSHAKSLSLWTVLFCQESRSSICSLLIDVMLPHRVGGWVSETPSTGICLQAISSLQSTSSTSSVWAQNMMHLRLQTVLKLLCTCGEEKQVQHMWCPNGRMLPSWMLMETRIWSLPVGPEAYSCAWSRGSQACHRLPWTQARFSTTR